LERAEVRCGAHLHPTVRGSRLEVLKALVILASSRSQ
jgi:hypothetical protein